MQETMMAGCIRIAGKNLDMAKALGDAALRKEVERLQMELDRVTEERDRLIAFNEVRTRRKMEESRVRYFSTSKGKIRRQAFKALLKDFVHLFVVREEDAE